MFLPDQPIKSSNQDILGRHRFAKFLYEAIVSYTDKNSLVLALYGDWGSGKTSIINLFLECLELSEAKNKLFVIHFNPWNFSNQNQLISQFFNILSNRIGKTNNSKKAKEIGEKLKLYSKIFTPFTVIPTIGPFASMFGSLVKNIGNASSAIGSINDENIDQLKEDLSKELFKLDKKILVIIDDIDRLTPSEIRQIFQLIKKIADFPNTIYLLAFDKLVVLNAFKEILNGFEKEYLEKIIQVPFEIPALTSNDIERIFFDQVNSILKFFDLELYDESYLINIYKFGLRYYFNNIRDITRFFNTFRFNLNLVGKEVNPVDFIAITAFQVFSPTFFYSIRDNIDLFTKQTEPFDGFLDDKKEIRGKRLNELLESENIIPRDHLLALLNKVFPTIETYVSNKQLTAEEFSSLRKNGRICISDNFYNYFKLSVSEYDITREEIRNILFSATNFEEFKESLIILNKQNRIVKFIDRILDYANDESIIPESKISIIISGLLDQGDNFPESPTGFIYVRNSAERIILIIAELLKRIDSQEKRYRILSESFLKAKNSIYILSFELSERFKEIKNKNYILRDEPIINEKHIIELKKVLCKIFLEWYNLGKLKNHIKLKDLLFSWREWCGNQMVSDFISKATKTNKELLVFLSKFVYKTSQLEYRDYVGKVSFGFDIKSLKEFLDVEMVKEKLYKISKSNSLNDNDKLIIDLFFNSLNEKNDWPT